MRPTSSGVIQRPRGAPEDAAELLARLADRRRVDDRHELLEVIGEDAIEEVLVAVLQRGQADVALEGLGLAHDVRVGPLGLLLDRVHPVGQQAIEPEARRSSA